MSRASLKLLNRYKIALMLLVGLLSSSSACKTGPDVQYWIVSELGLVYSLDIQLEYPLNRDFVCLSPRDQQLALQACKERREMPLLNWCAIERDAQKPLAGCSDGSVKEAGEIINWACLDIGDMQELLGFCKRRKMGI